MLKQNLQELRLGGRTRTFLQDRRSLTEPGYRLVAETSYRREHHVEELLKGRIDGSLYPSQAGNRKQLVHSDQKLPQQLLQLLVKP